MGRWCEGFGLGLISGVIVTFLISGWKYWYFLFAGLISLSYGAYLHENS